MQINESGNNEETKFYAWRPKCKEDNKAESLPSAGLFLSPHLMDHRATC
jgi:hypothetical protein